MINSFFKKIIIYSLLSIYSFAVNVNTTSTIKPEYFGAVGNGIVDDTLAVIKASKMAFLNHKPFEGNALYKVTTNQIPELAKIKRIGKGQFNIEITNLQGELQNDLLYVDPKRQNVPNKHNKKEYKLRTLVGLKDKYAAFPKGVMHKNEDILFAYYLGLRHVGGGPSEARAVISRDYGESWKDYFIAGNLTNTLKGYGYAYDTALGLDKYGNYLALITLSCNKDVERYRTYSQEGVFWSHPTKIHFGSVAGKLYKNQKRDSLTGDPATGVSEIVFFGNIKKMSNGTLVVMAYIANTNWLAVNDSGLGDTWNLRLIRENSDGLRISEMALGIAKNDDMIAIARVDGKISSMYQFVSFNKGKTWRPLGYTNLEKNGGNIPQNIEFVIMGGKEYFYLDRGVRMSISGTSKFANSYVRDQCLVKECLVSPKKWQEAIYTKRFPQNDDLGEEENARRDYYSTGIKMNDSNSVLVVIHEETKLSKTEESKIKLFSYILKE